MSKTKPIEKMSQKRKKVLFHLHTPPIPVTGGATQRMYGYLQYFHDRSQDYAVEIISHRSFKSKDWSTEQQHAVLSFVDKLHLYECNLFDYVYAKTQTVFYQKLRREQLPVDSDTATSPQFLQFARKVSQQTSYDFILINYLSFARLALLTANQKTTKLIDIHDISCQNRLALKSTGFRKNLKFDYQKNFEKEIGLLSQFNGIIANSKKEISDLEPYLTPDKLHLVPHLVQDPEAIDYFLPYPQRNFVYDLLFVGSGQHAPNVEGINFFLKEVFPKIVYCKPDVKLAIAGTVSDFAQFDRSLTTNLDLLGYVDDLSTIYSQSRIAICPLLNGAGTKVKLQEAMVYGLPIVTTATGASGLNLIDGINALIVDEADAYSEKILHVLNQVELANQLSSAITDTFQNDYSNTAVYSKLDHLFGITRSN